MRRTWAAWYWIFVLLVALFSDATLGRRGGGRGGSSSSKGRGSGASSSSASRGGFHSLPRKSTSSGQSQPGSSGSSRGAKVAGAAAVGAAVGYGLSSLGRSRYSRGGHGYSSSNKPASQPGFQNPNWSDPVMEGEVYSQASQKPCGVTLMTFSPVVCGLTYLLAQG